MRLIRTKKLRELEERANAAEALIGFAREQLREMKQLLDQMAPVVREFPRVADDLTNAWRESRELRERAETAERNYLLVGAALIEDEFPGHCGDD